MVKCYFCGWLLQARAAVKVPKSYDGGYRYLCSSCFEKLFNYCRETMSLEELSELSKKRGVKTENEKEKI